MYLDSLVNLKKDKYFLLTYKKKFQTGKFALGAQIQIIQV